MRPIQPAKNYDVISFARAMNDDFGPKVKKLFDPEREAALAAQETGTILVCIVYHLSNRTSYLYVYLYLFSPKCSEYITGGKSTLASILRGFEGLDPREILLARVHHCLDPRKMSEARL